jgi:hypothetical protein
MASRVESRPNLGLALRVLVPVALFGVVAAKEPGIVRETFESPAALVRIAILVIVWVVFTRLVARFVAPQGLRHLILGVPAAIFVWLVIVPYFQNESVVEPLPVAAGAPPVSTPAVSSPAASPPLAPGPPPSAAAAATGPVKVTTGQLDGIGHRASGEAALYRQTDGTWFVRLEGIDVQNSPDVRVRLEPGADREDPSGGSDLGELKGNRGSQNYEIPAGTDVSGPRTILLWCRAFSTPIANATQSPA